MKKITILLLLVINTVCFSQSITWQKAYKGIYTTDYGGNDICKADNGNLYIIGGSNYPVGVYIIKINPYGDTIWTRFIQQGESNAGISTSDGGCVVTGCWHTSPISSFALRINSSGETVWHKNYINSPVAICYRIIRTSDNKYVACGRISYGTAYYGYLMKLDSNGNMIWQKHIPANRIRIYRSLIETNEGNYIAGGWASDIAYKSDGVITKVDTSGNIIWDKRYSSYSQSMTDGLFIDKINQYYLIGGNTYDSTLGKWGIGFKRLNSDGNVVFSKHFPELLNDKFDFTDIKAINSNKYLLLYYRFSFFHDTLLANSIITDSMGNILKSMEFINTTFIILYRSFILNNGDIMFIGNSDNFHPDYTNIYAIRADSNLYVQPVGINNSNKIMPENFKLYQNYPNPFNSMTNVKFEMSNAGVVEIIVFDLQGKEVRTLVNEYKQAGTYQVKFNARQGGSLTDLPSGVYFYSLIVDDIFISTKKFVLIK
ncbi:MAG: T9SS type A sorting domain-containing protein [Ignavibacteria bacterium]|nr:T9SS type A sorting domain-containing protein [Ignavibacteria bacterium]